MIRKAMIGLVLGVCGLAGQAVAQAQPVATATAASVTPAKKACEPGRGCVTGLALPRFVSLKGSDGKARRGPGSNHRIDWVFTRPGMPLRVIAEYEHWRRVEDSEGVGGWMHYSLLSGSRSVLITEDLAPIRSAPDAGAGLVARAETGVVARVSECATEWCRIRSDGLRGWVPKSALWGVDAAETFD
jgi:SH3-like domain-containing protein